MKKYFLKAMLVCVFVGLVTVSVACNKSKMSNSSSGAVEPEVTEEITLRFTHFGSSQNIMHTDVFLPFADAVAEVTDSRVNFEIYSGGVLSNANETYNNIIGGIADAGWVVNGYVPGAFPAHSIFNMPFISRGNGEGRSVIMQEMYEDFTEIQHEYADVKPLWFFSADEYVIITRNKAVRTFEDIQGLKLRTPNAEGVGMIESWGAVPVSMPASDVYMALEKGVIDGTISSASQMIDFNLTEVVDYITRGNNFIDSVMGVMMNKASWEKISPEDQQAIEQQIIGFTMARKTGAAFDRQGEKAMEQAVASGVEIIELTEDELNKFKEASQGLVEEWISDMEGKGIPGRELYETVTEKFSH